MKINEPCRYGWNDIATFGLHKCQNKWPACSTYYVEFGKRYQVNPVLLALWGIIRSQNFTSKEYRENLDIYSLGGRHKTFADAIATGASELAKFEDTSMMQEQAGIEKLYIEFVEFMAGLPPAVEPPPPPKPPVEPPQKPAEPPPVVQPETPKEPEKPGEAPGWKKTIKKVAVWLTGIVSVAGVVVVLTPTPIDDIAVRVVKLIVEMISNL